MRDEHDIKAPDGYLLGGLRKVRSDGTILFQRGYWQAPKEWIGERVWVHEEWIGNNMVIEAAEPGLHIYTARSQRKVVICEPAKRPDAKPAYRRPENKAWVARMSAARDPDYETCKQCGDETHVKEAACIHCGTSKPWANEVAA
ncbi:hypothetical protein [Mesorhizobium sp.]|uniref:hypothetical protein n=1 Tax=Mesorhizobium sp. TaxID=1871066 RepID=UPI00121D4DC2|nr:hypothetical protein [Mesorhizobium sp.]TIN83071.1 MAG: hypothetical protein E5X97_27445 [Mesorhizobium sp.]